MSSRADLLSAVTQSIGIYGTAPTGYLSAMARVPDFQLDDLDQATGIDRSLVRVRTMRYSVYTLSHELLPIALAATKRQAMYPNSYRRQLADVYGGLSRRVEATLSEGPLSAAEIRTRVDPDRQLGSRFTILLGMMGAEGRIVRATRTGGWRSDRLTYARWSDWLPDIDPQSLDPGEARRRLAEHYATAYGPVDPEDLAWWAGWTKAETKEAAADLNLGQQGRAMELLDGVRLLPVWDVLLVAYRHRDRLLDPAHARFVYDRFGNATSVVLDRGRVVGVWDLGKSDDPLTITVGPLGRWPKRLWDDVARQARRIGELIGTDDVRIERREAPTDLLNAPRNRFLAPLSG
ncbi:MAG: winged helix DNA-binding domain-containing protein [Acidimicrobiia bacterium]|nr:winged helix DNA-binding domain-containing protein [Acidimicrobiia bacterium]MDH3397470.1 winged helix DNA-binding domain-containing protein [Acidimicrobiia bacterium]